MASSIVTELGVVVSLVPAQVVRFNVGSSFGH